MVGKVAKVPMNHRILRCDKTDIDFSGDPAINLSDTVFEFLDDEGERSSSSTYSICDNNVRDEDDENGEKEIVEDNDFWENQYNLLHVSCYNVIWFVFLDFIFLFFFVDSRKIYFHYE